MNAAGQGDERDTCPGRDCLIFFFEAGGRGHRVELKAIFPERVRSPVGFLFFGEVGRRRSGLSLLQGLGRE